MACRAIASGKLYHELVTTAAGPGIGTGTLRQEADAMAGDGEARQVVGVGVDGSAESIAALSWASRYAAATGAKVRAVHAWHYPSAFGVPPVGKAPPPVTAEVEQRMRDDMAQAVAQAYPDPDGAQPETALRYGHPVEVLIDESKAADLLVVGHQGHSAFTGMLVGSVSIHCVTSAACPVVVVRGG
jgi:nucleotide-binding universal stress UspA family protein